MAPRPSLKISESCALQVGNLARWMKHFSATATTGDLSQEAKAAAYAKLLGAAATAFMCPVHSKRQPTCTSTHILTPYCTPCLLPWAPPSHGRAGNTLQAEGAKMGIADPFHQQMITMHSWRHLLMCHIAICQL